MADSTPEADLLPRDSKEHLEAVQGLFVKHSRELRLFIRSLVPRGIDADDILQEVFLIVTRKASSFELGTNFLGWSMRIARFTVLKEIRDAKKLPDCLEEEILEILAPKLEAAVERDPGLEALATCMGRMDGRMKEFIKMRYDEGMKSRQIAEVSGWTPNAVYVALSRARRTLRECVERQLAKP